MENTIKRRKGAYYKGYELQDREIKLRVCNSLFEILDSRAAAQNICLALYLKRMIDRHLLEDES